MAGADGPRHGCSRACSVPPSTTSAWSVSTAAPGIELLSAGVAVCCLRDLTRGGLASALVEVAETAGVAITLQESAVLVREEVAAACELLGLDPFHVANEGRFVAFVPRGEVERALAILRGHAVAEAAAAIGEVRSQPAGEVSCRGLIGGHRAIDMLSGEQLPRIC